MNESNSLEKSKDSVISTSFTAGGDSLKEALAVPREGTLPPLQREEPIVSSLGIQSDSTEGKFQEQLLHKLEPVLVQSLSSSDHIESKPEMKFNLSDDENGLETPGSVEESKRSRRVNSDHGRPFYSNELHTGTDSLGTLAGEKFLSTIESVVSGRVQDTVKIDNRTKISETGTELNNNAPLMSLFDPPIDAKPPPSRIDSLGSLDGENIIASSTSVATQAAVDFSANDVKHLDAWANLKDSSQGRPPLHSNHLHISTDIPKPVHDRGHSVGEFSFMSALTEPSEDGDSPPPPHHKRDRSVSWEKNTVETVPRDAPESQRHHRRVETISEVNSETMSKSGVAIESKLALTDIVNPMETEAESHILRALEEQSRVTKPSSTSAVLPDLTDEAAESLESQIENSKSSSNSDLKLEDSLSVISGGSKKGSRKKKPSHRRTNTVASQLTIGSGEPNHMDATLFELSTVMRNIHNNANEEHAEDLEPMRGHHRVASQDIGHPIATSISDHPITGSDALANNAALLFRGKMKQAELVVVESSSNETDPKKNDDLIAEGSNESSDEQGSDCDVELGRPHSSAGESRRRHGRSIAEKMLDAAKADWDYLSEFLGHRRRGMYVYFRTLLFFLIIPALAISGLLFYFFGNPLMRGAGGASISWFLIFLLIRHSICFSIGKVSEIVLIDFFALKTGLILRMFGSVFTLLVINSKGWPSLISWWGFYGLCLLSGDSAFANHWLHWQSLIGLFNAKNPSGSVTDNIWNYRVLVAALVIGIVVSVKRFVVGLLLGRRQYATYGGKLASVIHKMIVISKVAHLARKLQKRGRLNIDVKKRVSARDSIFAWSFRGVSGDEGHVLKPDDANAEDYLGEAYRLRLLSSANGGCGDETESNQINAKRGDLRTSERNKITQALEGWEEPELAKNLERASIQGILQFKQSLDFGRADNREACIDSAQDVYNRLLIGNLPDVDDPNILRFETLISIMRNANNVLDESKMMDLVRIFRPDREGKLELVDFVRSVDRVYKELRLLRASIQSSSHIDAAFESVINVAFFFVAFCILLAAWGIDPLSLFLSFSSIILAFTFAIGMTSSKYFEGLIFILGRKPYDIGDRIAIQKIDDTPTLDHTFSWFVEDVTLFHTTVRLSVTNEVATIANSSLSNCRVINAARSPKALVYVFLKFGVDVPYTRIQIFKDALLSYIKERPREWLACHSFRAHRMQEDQGFIEYLVILQHRDSWQHSLVVLDSRANIMSYCLELQKLLGMRYVSPATPVDLTIKNKNLPDALGILSSTGSTGSPGPRHERTQSTDLRRVADLLTLSELFAPPPPPPMAAGADLE